MKIKVNWEALKAVLIDAAKYLVGGIVGAGIISCTGCSSVATTPRGQTTEIVALGIPAVAWITHTAQNAEHNGSDDYDTIVSNTTDVAVAVEAGK